MRRASLVMYASAGESIRGNRALQGNRIIYHKNGNLYPDIFDFSSVTACQLENIAGKGGKLWFDDIRFTYERLYPGSRPPTGIVPGEKAGAISINEK